MGSLIIPIPWTIVYGNSDTVYINHPVGVWRPGAAEVTDARVTLEVRGITNATYTLAITGGMELANVVDTIDNVISVGVGRTTNGLHYPNGLTDVSSSTDSAQLFRPVLRCLCSGAGLEFARVGGQLELITR